MKKLCALLVAVATILTLVACGGGGGQAPATEAAAPATEAAAPAEEATQAAAPAEQATEAAAPEEEATEAAAGPAGGNYDVGVTDTTIKIGNTSPQSGPVAALGGDGRGIDCYFKYVNDNGGVNGRQIEFIYKDDGYSPENAVANVKQLIEQDQVFALCGVLGTSCIKAYEGYVQEQGVPNVSIAAGASTFTDPVSPNTFVAALNYNVEGQMMAQFAVEELGGTTIGVFYQNDDFGKDYLDGISKFLATQDMEVAAASSYNTDDVDYSTQAMEMQQAGVDVILIAAMKTQAAAFVTELDKLGVRENVEIIANNSSGDDAAVMKDLCGDIWDGVYTSTYFPAFNENQEEFAEFYEYVEKYYPDDLSAPATLFFGWGCGEILVEALTRCGDDLTRENLMAQLETFDDWSGKYIYHITYTPDEHIGSRCMRICIAKDGVNTSYSDWMVFED